MRKFQGNKRIIEKQENFREIREFQGTREFQKNDRILEKQENCREIGDFQRSTRILGK